MSQEVYALFRVKGREALWQPSENELDNPNHGMRKASEGIGVRMLARFSVGPSVFIRLYVYPDMESLHKVQMALGPGGLNTQRYWDVELTIGYEAPPVDAMGNPEGYAYSRQDDLPLL